MDPASSQPPPSPAAVRLDPASTVAAGLLLAALGWTYRSNFVYLARFWEDSNYSHGWLIGPIALAILWQRRDRVGSIEARPRWWGVLPLAALLALRYPLYERNEQWFEAATIPLAAGAVLLAVGGWGWLKWASPALIYLFFMLPLPPRLNEILAGPLQTVATIGSAALLQAARQAVVTEGNVILIGSQRLEVAEACRGLSMLLSFVALIAAMIILVKRPIWERVVLALSTIPIAILCNIVRIAVTAVLYDKAGHPVQAVHDWAGLAMMLLALLLVGLELKVMSWLVIEEQEVAAPGLLRASYGNGPGMP